MNHGAKNEHPKLKEVREALSPGTARDAHIDYRGKEPLKFLTPSDIQKPLGALVEFSYRPRRPSEFVKLIAVYEILQLIEEIRTMPNQSPSLDAALTTLSAKVDALINAETEHDAALTTEVDALSDKIDAKLSPATDQSQSGS
jgi:hypothetical protein